VRRRQWLEPDPTASERWNVQLIRHSNIFTRREQ
jgi:hypothetical protein